MLPGRRARLLTSGRLVTCGNSCDCFPIVGEGNHLSGFRRAAFSASWLPYSQAWLNAQPGVASARRRTSHANAAAAGTCKGVMLLCVPPRWQIQPASTRLKCGATRKSKGLGRSVPHHRRVQTQPVRIRRTAGVHRQNMGQQPRGGLRSPGVCHVTQPGFTPGIGTPVTTLYPPGPPRRAAPLAQRSRNRAAGRPQKTSANGSHPGRTCARLAPVSTAFRGGRFSLLSSTVATAPKKDGKQARTANPNGSPIASLGCVWPPFAPIARP